MEQSKTYTSPDENGYYGIFGGAYIPEMLYRNVEELKKKYLEIINEENFKKEYKQLLHDYVGRPTPLFFAERLSKQYNTNIFLKREDLCHTGAHKINNTVGQILLAQRLGKKRIIAETGAGQHGVATATVCALKGIECVVYMGEKDIERQAPNVARMKMLGATVVSATSGSKTLKDATNEAIRDWINHAEDTHYIIGSVVGPHPYPDMVAIFQSIISKEIRSQLKEKIGKELPSHVIACVGGGSNAAGAFYHFLDEENVQLVAVEAAGHGVHSGKTAATTQLGRDGILHGSKSLVMQTEDGQVVEPHSISAGLDYPGIGPMHAHLFQSGRGKFLFATDKEAVDASFEVAKLEGIIPALETGHAFAALKQLQLKDTDTVVICLSGRGDKDLATYMKVMDDLTPGPSPKGEGSKSPTIEKKDYSEQLHKNADPVLFHYAREGRKEATKAEELLWDHLRNKQLNGLKFRRQHPLDKYIADFYCHEKKLVIEIDGNIHDLKEVQQYDAAREKHLVDLGLKLLRFTNEEVNKNLNLVLQKIKEQVKL